MRDLEDGFISAPALHQPTAGVMDLDLLQLHIPLSQEPDVMYAVLKERHGLDENGFGEAVK